MKIVKQSEYLGVGYRVIKKGSRYFVEHDAIGEWEDTTGETYKSVLEAVTKFRRMLAKEME